MTASLILNDILVWSLQIGFLVALAAVLPPTLQLKMPKARLTFWQLVLVTCLLLPFVRAWKQEAISEAVTISTAVVSLAPGPPARDPSRMHMGSLLLFLIAAGVAVHLGLLLFGFWRLHRYRLQSQPLVPSSSWSAEADLCISEEIASPVTFGFRKPFVLLPTRFSSLDEAMQDAILCHEVLHIRRRDWLFTVGEELVRAVLWFHPAIWWLLREIQLVREQVVDREVVEMTRSRDRYIDALLVIAGAQPQIDLAPAPLFLRKRHLKRRVVSILKEVQMSKAKSISALAVSLTLLAASCWFVTGVLPLEAAPQVVADASGVSVETNGAQLMHRQRVDYPREAIAKGVQGTVVAQVKLDTAGNVTDATIVSGPEELRKAVLQSVLTWHFTRDAALSTRQVSVSFEAPKAAQQAVLSGAPVPAAVRMVVPPNSIAPQLVVLKTITTAGLSDQQANELLARLPVHVGDSVTPATMTDLAETIHAFDEHLSFQLRRDELYISAPDAARTDAVFNPAPPPPPGAAPLEPPAALRIGAEVQKANLLNQVKPAYPPLAKAAHVQGTVSFQITIGKDGTVQNVQLLSGPPLLVQAAMQSVSQWVYKPTLLNGNPVAVITTADVNFTLAE